MGSEEEAKVDHGGEVDAGGEFFGFGDAAGFAGRCGGGDFGHGIWFWYEMREEEDPINESWISCYL